MSTSILGTWIVWWFLHCSVELLRVSMTSTMRCSCWMQAKAMSERPSETSWCLVKRSCGEVSVHNMWMDRWLHDQHDGLLCGGLFLKKSPFNQIFGEDRSLRAWYRGIKKARARKRAQGPAQEIPYHQITMEFGGYVFWMWQKKTRAQGRSARGPIRPKK